MQIRTYILSLVLQFAFVSSSMLFADLISVQVAASVDDARQLSEDVTWSSPVLRFGVQSTNLITVGMRFTDITIPKSAIINSANITYTASNSDTAAASFTYRGEDIGNAGDFGPATGKITDRPTTTATVLTGFAPAWTAGMEYQSPDLKPIVQEIVDREDWDSGNALAFIVPGSGIRRARAFDFDVNTNFGPTLTVDFTSIPEPGSLTLSTLATAGLFLARWRRRRKLDRSMPRARQA